MEKVNFIILTIGCFLPGILLQPITAKNFECKNAQKFLGDENFSQFLNNCPFPIGSDNSCFSFPKFLCVAISNVTKAFCNKNDTSILELFTTNNDTDNPKLCPIETAYINHSSYSDVNLTSISQCLSNNTLCELGCTIIPSNNPNVSPCYLWYKIRNFLSSISATNKTSASTLEKSVESSKTKTDTGSAAAASEHIDIEKPSTEKVHNKIKPSENENKNDNQEESTKPETSFRQSNATGKPKTTELQPQSVQDPSLMSQKNKEDSSLPNTDQLSEQNVESDIQPGSDDADLKTSKNELDEDVAQGDDEAPAELNTEPSLKSKDQPEEVPPGVNAFNNEPFIEAEDSHFFIYFLTSASIFILGYVAFHNKNKILAYALEGRRNRPARRRPNSACYKKLDCNLEEAITSNSSHASVTNVVY